MARLLHIDILAVLFGIGTWVCVNGLWVELPLLVLALPEGWNLPSYLSIVTQLANVGPLGYTILHSLFPRQVTEKGTIYLTMTIGSVSTILLVFFWNETTHLFGTERSTALLVLVFTLAFVDCSSRVLFLPFMARFQTMYLTSFFIGEGLSGFVPSIFALIQGVGGNPECRWVNTTLENSTEVVPELQAFTPPPVFTIETFFYFLFGTMLLSALAFHLLTYRSITKGALATGPARHESPTEVLLNTAEPPTSFYQSTSPTTSLEEINKAAAAEEEDSFQETSVDEARPKRVPIVPAQNGNGDGDGRAHAQELAVKGKRAPSPKPEKEALFTHVSKPMFIYLLTIQGIICCFANGVFPSIQSYSCLPYGNVAYHWAVTLSTMANPAVCFLLFVLPRPTKSSVTTICVAAVAVSAYVFATSVMSPNPPLVGRKSGEALLIMSWILQVAFFTYVKVSIATILRAEGKRGLFWCGAVTQAGSAIGAFVTFFIVNNTGVFQSFNACTEESHPMLAPLTESIPWCYSRPESY